MKAVLVLVVLGILAGGYLLFKNKEPVPTSLSGGSLEQTRMNEKTLTLSSPAFEHMGKIPSRYTCDGEKISPPLEISGVTSSAKSLVLIMEDPDVPLTARADGMWDHWLRFNLPISLSKIGEGQEPGGVAGINTSKNLNYVPPCPPDKEHRYFFYLYSLDAELSLKSGATKREILSAMEGHILQQATLIGLYERQK